MAGSTDAARSTTRDRSWSCSRPSRTCSRRIHPRARRLPLVRRQRGDVRRRRRRRSPTTLRERGIVPWLVLDEGGAVVDAPLPFALGMRGDGRRRREGRAHPAAERARRRRPRIRAAAHHRGRPHRARDRPARRRHVPPRARRRRSRGCSASSRTDARGRAQTAAAHARHVPVADRADLRARWAASRPRSCARPSPRPCSRAAPPRTCCRRRRRRPSTCASRSAKPSPARSGACGAASHDPLVEVDGRRVERSVARVADRQRPVRADRGCREGVVPGCRHRALRHDGGDRLPALPPLLARGLSVRAAGDVERAARVDPRRRRAGRDRVARAGRAVPSGAARSGYSDRTRARTRSHR